MGLGRNELAAVVVVEGDAIRIEPGLQANLKGLRASDGINLAKARSVIGALLTPLPFGRSAVMEISSLIAKPR